MSLVGPLPRARSAWGGRTRRYKIDPEQVLADAQEVAVTEGVSSADGDIGTVGGAQVGHGEGCRLRPSEPDGDVAAGHERIVGEHDVTRFATDDCLVAVQVEHVSRDPLDGALAESRIPRKHGRPEEQRTVLRRRAKPLLRVLHGLKP